MGKSTDDEHIIARLAFVELVVFIEEFHMDDETFLVFKLVELVELTQSRMEQHKVSHDSRMHTTHLKRIVCSLS